MAFPFQEPGFTSLRIGPNGIEFRDPLGQIPAFIEDGAGKFLTSAICDIVGYQQASYAALGLRDLEHFAAAARAAGRCYGTSSPQLPLTPRQIVGGQCSAQYSVAGVIRYRYRTTTTGFNFTHTGPIYGIELRDPPAGIPGAEVWAFSASYPNGGKVQNGSSNIANDAVVSWEITQMVRVGGGADNCGNGPVRPNPYPRLPAPPSLPGPPPFVVRPQTNFNFSFDFGLGPVILGFVAGPIIFNPDFSVSFPFGPFNFDISPDFNVSVRGRSLKEREECDNEAIQDIQEKVTELFGKVGQIEDRLGATISGTATAVKCDDEQIDVQFSGQGLLGLANQAQAWGLALTQLGNSACPSSPPPPVYEKILLGTFVSGGGRGFKDYLLPSLPKFVHIVADTSFPAYSTGDGGDGNDADIQSRFGQVSFLGEDGGVFLATPTVNQYFSGGVYEVPAVFPPVTRVRVSLYGGSSAQVYAVVEVSES